MKIIIIVPFIIIFLFFALYGIAEYLEKQGNIKLYGKIETFFTRLERVTIESIFLNLKNFISITFNL